jgi:hypothetical protein
VAATRGVPARRRAARTRTGPCRPRAACRPCRDGSVATHGADRHRSRATPASRRSAGHPHHNTAINARNRRPWRSSPAWRITRMISSARGGSAGYCIPLLCGARPARYPGTVAGDRRRPAASTPTTQTCDMGGSSQARCPGQPGTITAHPRPTDTRGQQTSASFYFGPWQTRSSSLSQPHHPPHHDRPFVGAAAEFDRPCCCWCLFPARLVTRAPRSVRWCRDGVLAGRRRGG